MKPELVFSITQQAHWAAAGRQIQDRFTRTSAPRSEDSHHALFVKRQRCVGHPHSPPEPQWCSARASHCARPSSRVDRKLDTSWNSGAPRRGHHLNSADLPTIRNPSSRLPSPSPAWIGWFSNAAHLLAHARCLATSAKNNPSKIWLRSAVRLAISRS